MTIIKSFVKRMELNFHVIAMPLRTSASWKDQSPSVGSIISDFIN